MSQAEGVREELLAEICERCGAKRLDIGGYGTIICPFNCDSPYMLHNQASLESKEK